MRKVLSVDPANTRDCVRESFFHDGSWKTTPFKGLDWRGCVLDRDLYDSARLPEMLWQAVVSVSECQEMFIWGDFSGVRESRRIVAEWVAYTSFMSDLKNYSPEYIVYDDSALWVIDADFDATTVGLSGGLATKVDDLLRAKGTSLIDLTLASFSIDSIRSENGRYVRGVLGEAAIVEMLQRVNA